MKEMFLGLFAFAGLSGLFILGVDSTMKINDPKYHPAPGPHFMCMAMCESSRGKGFEDIQKKSERVCYALCNRKYK